jgi:glycosyltransferase involved in cell wall biosynthesis
MSVEGRRVAEARELRILYLVHGLGTGGVERSVVDLIPHLADRGVSLEFACMSRRSVGVQGEIDSTRLRFIGAANKAARVREVRHLLKRLRPDVLHTTMKQADLIGRLAAIGTKTPVLTSLVNPMYEPERVRADPSVSPRRMAVVRLVDGYVGANLTDHFHAVSESVKRSAINRLRIPPDRITVVGRGRETSRLGVPSPERRAQVRVDLGLTEFDEVVFTAGRQENQKGHRFLLEAISLLRPHRPNLRLLVAGQKGRATPDLVRSVDRLGLQDVVRFLGYRNDIGDLLCAADVFCFPSVYEGFGGAALEAMAMGVPVVASDIPALREVVGETGILVPPELSDELGTALTRVLDDRILAAELAAEARVRVSNRFPIVGIADQMADLYRQVASN